MVDAEEYKVQSEKPSNNTFDLLAKRLHKERYIYGAYGLLDGLNLALTIPKLGFELCYFNSTINYVTEFHHFMGSPAGIAVMVLCSTCFIGLSVFGSFFSEKDENWFKRNLAIVWPYIRDMLKAFKWAFKGVRNTFVALEKNISGIHFLVLPIGLTLAALSIVNRMWYRSMKSERKVMQDTNDAYAKQVERLEDAAGQAILLDGLDQWREYRLTVEQRLKEQLQDKNYIKERSFLSAAYSGAVEGLYFYFATATLTVYIPPIFIAMMVFSTFLTLSYICSRLFEEYDYQRKLTATSIKAHIALSKQEIHFTLLEMKKPNVDFVSLKLALGHEKSKYTALQKELEDNIRFSYLLAVLDGVKHGLATQGVLSSLMLCVVTVLLLSGVACPPIFIIVLVCLGVGFVLACIVAALMRHHAQMQKSPLTGGDNPALDGLIASLELDNIDHNATNIAAELSQPPIEASNTDAPYFGGCEILRQVFSGGIKGPKAGDEIMYHDPDYSGIMLWLSISVSFVLASLSSAGRALAKEFGSPEPTDSKPPITQGFFKPAPASITPDSDACDYTF